MEDVVIEGARYRVHNFSQCEGRTCVVHAPTEHHMRTWPLLWRFDRGIFERTCQHGVGHPDPDQFHYWRDTGQWWQATHGCDGCCVERTSDERATGSVDDRPRLAADRQRPRRGARNA